MRAPFEITKKADVIRLLDKHCDGDGDNATYHAGWSDLKISQDLDVPIKNVGNMRIRLKGAIATRRPSGTIQDIYAELKLMRQRILLLERKVIPEKATTFDF